MVHSYEVGSGGECTFDHEFCEGRADGGEDVAAAQHGGADRHEICNCMLAIADELLIIS